MVGEARTGEAAKRRGQTRVGDQTRGAGEDVAGPAVPAMSFWIITGATMVLTMIQMAITVIASRFWRPYPSQPKPELLARKL